MERHNYLKRIVLQHCGRVNSSIEVDRSVIICGTNGLGKTTVLRMLTGLLLIDSSDETAICKKLGIERPGKFKEWYFEYADSKAIYEIVSWDGSLNTIVMYLDRELKFLYIESGYNKEIFLQPGNILKSINSIKDYLEKNDIPYYAKAIKPQEHSSIIWGLSREREFQNIVSKFALFKLDHKRMNQSRSRIESMRTFLQVFCNPKMKTNVITEYLASYSKHQMIEGADQLKRNIDGAISNLDDYDVSERVKPLLAELSELSDRYIAVDREKKDIMLFYGFLYHQSEDWLTEFRDGKDSYEQDLMTLENNINNAKYERSQLKDDYLKEKGDLELIIAGIQKKKSDFDKGQPDKIRTQVNNIEVLEERIENIRNTISVLEGDLDNAKSAIQKAEAELNKKRLRITEKIQDMEISQLDDAYKKYKSELDRIEKQYNDTVTNFNDQINETNQVISGLRKKINENEINAMKWECRSIEQDSVYRKHRENYDHYNKEIEEIKLELKQLSSVKESKTDLYKREEITADNLYKESLKGVNFEKDLSVTAQEKLRDQNEKQFEKEFESRREQLEKNASAIKDEIVQCENDLKDYQESLIGYIENNDSDRSAKFQSFLKDEVLLRKDLDPKINELSNESVFGVKIQVECSNLPLYSDHLNDRLTILKKGYESEKIKLGDLEKERVKWFEDEKNRYDSEICKIDEKFNGQLQTLGDKKRSEIESIQNTYYSALKEITDREKELEGRQYNKANNRNDAESMIKERESEFNEKRKRRLGELAEEHKNFKHSLNTSSELIEEIKKKRERCDKNFQEEKSHFEKEFESQKEGIQKAILEEKNSRMSEIDRQYESLKESLNNPDLIQKEAAIQENIIKRDDLNKERDNLVGLRKQLELYDEFMADEYKGLSELESNRKNLIGDYTKENNRINRLLEKQCKKQIEVETSKAKLVKRIKYLEYLFNEANGALACFQVSDKSLLTVSEDFSYGIEDLESLNHKATEIKSKPPYLMKEIGELEKEIREIFFNKLLIEIRKFKRIETGQIFQDCFDIKGTDEVINFIRGIGIKLVNETFLPEIQATQSDIIKNAISSVIETRNAIIDCINQIKRQAGVINNRITSFGLVAHLIQNCEISVIEDDYMRSSANIGLLEAMGELSQFDDRNLSDEEDLYLKKITKNESLKLLECLKTLRNILTGIVRIDIRNFYRVKYRVEQNRIMSEWQNEKENSSASTGTKRILNIMVFLGLMTPEKGMDKDYGKLFLILDEVLEIGSDNLMECREALDLLDINIITACTEVTEKIPDIYDNIYSGMRVDANNMNYGIFVPEAKLIA